MGIVALLGSFPNSQVRPRKATQTEETGTVPVPSSTVTTIAAANPNRTFLTIKNEGPTEIRWGTAAVPPTALSGFLLGAGEGIDIETPEEIQVITTQAGTTEVSVEEGEG